MKLNIYSIGLVATALTGLMSCSSDNSTHIYIPEAKTIQIRNFDLGEVLVETFHLAVEGSEYPTTSGMTVSSETVAKVEADPTKVDYFNESCGTSYTLLPSDCYTLQNEVVIEAGKSISADVELRIDAQGKIKPFDTYLLPVSITSISGGEIAAEQTTIYYLLSGAEDVWNMPLDDRSDWKVVSFSSEEASGEGSDNGHAIHAFDGLENTFWHTQWKNGEPQPPHDIVVDMGKEVKMLGWQYVTRDHGAAWPQEITIETSLDGEKWESAGTYSDLPGAGGKEYRSYLPGFKQARYFRLTITAVYSGSWSTHIAEINAITM